MAAEPAIVETQSGKLRGAQSNGALSFKGISYAADTGGVKRFMAPQPVAGWTGVRDATAFGDRCAQEFEDIAQTPVFSWYGQTEPFSENCCVLNVFTPGLSGGPRPVMMYIHGGGYITGGGGGAVLDGSNLAKFGDVVVVTLNHRLSVFGYTCMGHLDTEHFGDAANAGQLDLIAALKWVKANIAAFGGDPDSVTIFGQSGGGSKISVLMGMPEAKGLFHRAINMSGPSGFNLSEGAATEGYANEILKVLGIAKGELRRLQDVPVDVLLKARKTAATVFRSEGSRPVIDGRHIPFGPISPQGLAFQADVPLLAGNANSESAFHLRADMRNFGIKMPQLRTRIMAQFGLDDARADALIAAYLRDEPDRTPGEILVGVASDTLVRVPMLRGVEAKADAKQAPVYLYNFVWKSPADGGIWGSPHTIDIPFAFGNTARAKAITGGTAEAEAVSRNLMAVFVAFARTGNPNNAHMPQWKPYDTTARATMTIGAECRLVDDFHGAARIAASQLRLDPYNRNALFAYRD